MVRTRGLRRLLAALLALTLIAAACGGDDTEADDGAAAETDDGAATETDDGAAADTDDGDTEESGAAEAGSCGLGNGEEATGDPIPVGAIVGATGPDDFSSAADAAQAYFACVNANGGINGRPIQYLVEDDQWNPEVAGQVAARLVQDEGVVAMVGGASFVECGVNAQLYADEGVLSMPGVGVPRQCFESANIAPLNSGPRLSTIGVVQYLADELGAESFTCVALNIPGLGDWVCEGVTAWAETRGFEVVTQLIDPALPDPTAVALDAISAGTDAVLLSLPAGPTVPVLAAVEQQDGAADTIWAGPTSLFDLDFPETIGGYWDDRLWVQIEFDTLDSDGADNQEWIATMDAWGEADDPRDSFSQAGFLAAKIFVEALLGVEDSSTIDRTVAAEAMRAIVTESDLHCGPWYFGDGDRHNANHDGRIVSVTGGDYALLADCAPIDDPALAEILAAEAELGIG